MPRLWPCRRLGLALTVVALPCLAWGQPLGTTFTYQGRLTDGGAPASGAYDFQFVVYDAAVGGSPAGPVLTRDDVPVAGGLFTVTLDFGAVFGTARRWLDVGVRPSDSTGPYTPLAPRQELTPAPAALAAPWSGVAGKPPGFADDVDDDSGGDVTGVTAGAGLLGGGQSGALSLAVSFGSSGVADTASRSDHTHFGEDWEGARNNTTGLSVRNTGNVGGGLAGIAATNGIGVWGINQGSDVGTGVHGSATGTIGNGVSGQVSATTGAPNGVRGQAAAPGGRGVFGVNTSATGAAHAVEGETASVTGTAIMGRAVSATGGTVGVWGQGQSLTGAGVYGVGGQGVLGQAAALSPGGWGSAAAPRCRAGCNTDAGYFVGRAHVTGALSKGGGAFKIDHPLAPEDKYLYHSFVESPDMKNIYNGNITTDAAGHAAVEMPEWFEALNRDFRYQLTVIGQFAQAIVAEEVAGNRFAIRTDKPRRQGVLAGDRHPPGPLRRKAPHPGGGGKAGRRARDLPAPRRLGSGQGPRPGREAPAPFCRAAGRAAVTR